MRIISLKRMIKNQFCQKEKDITQCGVYKMFHIDRPEKIYIGSAAAYGYQKPCDNGFSKRFYHHIYNLKKGTHHSRHFQNIVNKYGLDGVRFEILLVCNSEDCIKHEQDFIDKLKPVLNGSPTAGNCVGFKHRPETIELWRMQRTGRKMSEEAKEAIRSALKGRRTRPDISNLWSKEARMKAAEKIRGKKKDPRIYAGIMKKVHQFAIDGEFIQSFDGIGQAARSTSIDRASINNCALGNRVSAGGYLWSFSDKAEPIKPLRLIIQKTLQGDPIREFNSVSEAARALNLSSTTAIRNCFNGKQKQAYGYRWEEVYNHYREAIEMGLSVSKHKKAS